MMNPSNFRLFRTIKFPCGTYQLPLECQNSSRELLSFRRKIKNYENIFYCHNTFFPFVS